MYLGRFEESIREMKRALELDPVSLIINGSLGRAYFMARQFDQALAQLHETLEMDPNFALTRLILGNAYLAKHQFSEGIDELRKARELSGDAVVMVGTLGVAYATAGKLEEAKGILEGLKARSQKQYVSSYWIGRVFGAIGDVDKLFELWNKAYEERTEWLIEIKSDPSLVPYQSDPRYKAILKKMGFEYGE
jgi:tetratricopeptide (TPR) repeat protein